MFLPYSGSFISHFLTFRAIIDTMFPDISLFFIHFWSPFVYIHSLHPPHPTRGDFTPLLRLVHGVNSLSCIHCGKILSSSHNLLLYTAYTVWILWKSLANNMDLTTRLWLPLIYKLYSELKTLDNEIYWVELQIVTTIELVHNITKSFNI